MPGGSGQRRHRLVQAFAVRVLTKYPQVTCRKSVSVFGRHRMQWLVKGRNLFSPAIVFYYIPDNKRGMVYRSDGRSRLLKACTGLLFSPEILCEKTGIYRISRRAVNRHDRLVDLLPANFSISLFGMILNKRRSAEVIPVARGLRRQRLVYAVRHVICVVAHDVRARVPQDELVKPSRDPA